MPTLAQLSEQGTIQSWDPYLGLRRQAQRLLYVSPVLAEWLQHKLPGLVSQHNIEETPIEQAEALAITFVSGETLTFGHRFSPLHPHPSGVWELKTADLRLFGWFPKFDVFLAVIADEAWRVKEFKLYRGYVDTVVRFREALPLDPPKFIEGIDPRALVSAFDYP